MKSQGMDTSLNIAWRTVTLASGKGSNDISTVREMEYEYDLSMRRS